MDRELLQGSWDIASLELDGEATPASALVEARIEIKGDAFTSLGMGAEYSGKIQLDPKARPRRIDLHFDSGPEQGRVNRGIYELKAKTWKLCLATHGDAAPSAFATAPGTGYALETLKKEPKKRSKPEEKRHAKARQSPSNGASTAAPTELEGEWRMMVGVMNGVAMDDASMQWVRRVNQGNISTVTAGPQTMLKVEFTTDDSKSPRAIDYRVLAGSGKGKTQLGIYAFERGELMICVGAPGAPRPGKFESVKGDQRTFTVWKKA